MTHFVTQTDIVVSFECSPRLFDLSESDAPLNVTQLSGMQLESSWCGLSISCSS